MNDNITIRDARTSDYGFLCSAFAQANREHCEMAPEQYREVEPIISKKSFYLAAIAQRFNFGRQRVCAKIAEKDGEPVGAVFALSTKRGALSWSKFHKEAYLDNVVVLPEHRRQGIATELVMAAKKWAKDTGHPHMTAKIICQNEASLALFEKAGLKPISVNVGMHIN